MKESSTGPTNRREQQAAETRELILNAARRLFAAQGFGATSIAQIAREAGVAIPTIYKSIGTKLDLLGSLNERVAADAEVDTLVPRLMSTRDPVELLALQIQLSRRLNERAGDIIRAMETAATVEPQMAGPYQAGIQRHRDGMHATAERLASLGALNDTFGIEQATALLDITLAPTSWKSLTEGHGLSFDEAEVLLVSALGKLLIEQHETPLNRSRRAPRADQTQQDNDG